MGFWEDLDAQNQSDIQNLKAQKEERAAREAQEQAEAEAAQAAEEAEANKSWLDRAEDETVNTARWVYNGLRSAAETVGEDVYGTAKNIVEAVSRLPEAYNRVLDTEQTITSAFTQENLAQAQETGDYSAQNEALAHAQENSTVVVDTAANLAGAFSRETRHIIGDQVDDAAEAGGWAPQSFRRSETFLEYFQSDEKKLQRAREIESVTGIPADSFLQDEAAYKEALGVYDYTKKMQNALGEQFSMDAVWQAYPELWDVAHMSTQDAALALHHMAEVRTTHGIVESFRSMLEFGNLQLEYNNLQYKIGSGTATDEDRKRAMELQEEMQKQKWQKELPSIFDEPVAVMAGSVASFVPMLAQQIQMAAEDAAPWMLSATWAGGAAGSVLPGVGTAAGAAAGGATGLARFGWLLVRNLAGVVESGSLAKTAAQVAGRVGFFEGMRRPMTGEKYHALGELTKEDGSPLLSREARWDYAQANGLVNAALGMTNLGMLGKALKGAPHATRITADVIARAQMNAGAVESMKAFARDRGMDVLKATATGAAVPGLMSVSDDVVHNQIAADTGETSIGVYSLHDMAVRGLQASVEMLPGALGFALVAGAGGTVTGGLGRAAALRHQAAFEARYGREAQRTMLGTAMFERLQQALKDSRLKQDAPEVTQQILRSQLKGTGFETVYIDTEMAAAKEHGMEDLRAVAKAAGLTDEELQQAVDQKGTITIAGEQFAQAASSPELLDAASFSPEAESMARMREGAKATLDAIRERSERTLREQEALQKGILDHYFPEDSTQETAEKRDALAAAMMQNPENPAEGWKQVRGEYRAQLDEILAPALAALKDGMGKGGLTMEIKDADGFTHTIRYSENSPWYKNFWAMNKRAPTAAELEDMAIALTTGDASAPKVEGWIVPDAETQAAMEQTRPIIEALQKNLAALDRVKSTARSLNGVEMELTRGMSGEAFQVYKDLTRGLEKAPARAAQAARMGAVIFARHADIFARKMAEKTGAKYTALDYYRGRFGLDTVGEYRPGGAAYAQPVTEADLALDQQVPVLDLDTMDNSLRGKSPKEVLDYIKQNLPKETIPTADFKAQVGIPEDKYGKAHLVWGRSSADAANRAARNATLTNLEAVIGHSYLVEVVPNTKTKPTDGMQGTQKKTQARKNRVDEFYRFIVPVKINGEMETLILVAENVHGNLKINEGETSLYEIYAAKKESRPYSQQESAQDSRIHATKGDSLSTVSIRDALRGVKDFLHQPYVDEEGRANYGTYMKNGVMYFDKAQADQYRQEAGESARTLTAYHNISARDLSRALAFGGFPVPSLAVMKAGTPYDMYGDITLVGNRDLVDPQKGVPVYSRDGYTVTFPAIEHSAPKKSVVKAFIEKWEEAFQRAGEENTLTMLEQQPKYIDSHLNKVRNSRAMQVYYLENVLGKRIEIPRMQAQYQLPVMKDEGARGEILAALALPDASARAAAVRTAIDGYYTRLLDQLKDKKQTKLLNVRKERLTSEYDEWKETFAQGENAAVEKLQEEVDDVSERTKNAGVDRLSLQSLLSEQYRDIIFGNKYQDWVEAQLKELAGDDKVRIGNRLYPFTAENVLKYMLKNAGKGKEHGLGVGMNQAAAMAAHRFTSIEDMHAQEGKLGSKDAYVAAKKHLEETVDTFRQDISQYRKDERWDAIRISEDAMEAAGKSADKSGHTTVERLRKSLAKTGAFREDIPDEVLQEGVDMMNALSDATVQYFEAKPQRIVDISEFSGAVVPEGTDAGLIKRLEDAGLQVETYTRENAAERQRATERVQAERPETFFQAAMYENRAQDFRTFRENVLLGKAGKSYQYVGKGANVLKVTSDDVKHIQQGKHEHPLTDAQWDDFISNLDNIEEVRETGGMRYPRGVPVVAKIKTASNCFGAVLEFADNGDVYVRTVLAGTEKQVDALMKKREAGVRRYPGLPSRTAEAGDNHAVTTSHSLSFSSIQEKLGISKRENGGNETLSQGGRVNKGLITPLSDGRRIITLLEDADASTFVHEMGHLFLMDLADLAQVDEVSAKELALVDDWANWKQGAAKEYKNTPWAGEFNTREKNILAAEAAGDFDTADRLKRGWRQERFARAFELYLREGKAPAKGLKRVFQQFKDWLRFVYTAFTGDGGRASEPVRRVMDRMIATEEEIEAMRLDDRYRDVEAAGGEKLLTESERETYERWKKDAEEEAKTQLRKIVMQDLSARRQQEFDARVDRERERYQKELEQNPVVLAKRALDLSGDEAIVKEFGFDDLNALGEEAFKEENMEGGLSPMQDGWVEAALKEHMDAYTKELDKELVEAYLTEDAVIKAMESSEYHAKLEGLVATALAKKMGLMKKITAKAERAMMSIEDKLTALPEDVDIKTQQESEPVKRLMKAINELRFASRWSPADYASIERMVKAATKADIEAALKDIKAAAKEDQANEKAVLEANKGRLEMYRRVAAESIQKMELADATNVRRYRKQEQEAARRVRQMIQAKRWDMALRAQEQKAMAAEMAKQAERMQSEVQKKLARVKKQLSARSVKLPRDERYWHRHLAYLLRIASTDAEKPEPRPVKDVDGKVVRVEEVQGLQELFKSMEDGLDTTEELSPFALVEKIASAGENFRGWQSLTRAEFDGAVDALTVLYTVGRDKFKMKTIGGKDIAEVLDEILADTSGDANYMKYAFETESGREMLSKENVLAMALNLGTKNNVQRLVAGFGAKEEAIRAFVQEHMTEKDWAFVQSVWDYLSSYWPETVATEEKLNGVTLKKEPAVPFTVKTADGKTISMKGGYYPIKYAAEKSIKAANQEENRAAESALAGARVLGTGRDFTKGRSDYVARPLRLELSVIPEHVQEVIHKLGPRAVGAAVGGDVQG